VTGIYKDFGKESEWACWTYKDRDASPFNREIRQQRARDVGKVAAPGFHGVIFDNWDGPYISKAPMTQCLSETEIVDVAT
jgi:predicted TIM-barrel enzyme